MPDNKKITVYDISVWRSHYELNEEVNRLIDEGYQPYGQPFARGDCICQAMVKYAEGLSTRRVDNGRFLG